MASVEIRVQDRNNSINVNTVARYKNNFWFIQLFKCNIKKQVSKTLYKIAKENKIINLYIIYLSSIKSSFNYSRKYGDLLQFRSKRYYHNISTVKRPETFWRLGCLSFFDADCTYDKRPTRYFGLLFSLKLTRRNVYINILI